MTRGSGLLSDLDVSYPMGFESLRLRDTSHANRTATGELGGA